MNPASPPTPRPPAGEPHRWPPGTSQASNGEPPAKKGTGWCYWLTVNTREGIGVRSCGWIMERTEGRWPSLDPTKNSLWIQKRAGHQLHPRATQAGWRVERACAEDGAPYVLVSLTDSAGKEENSGGLLPPPLARVHNDLLKESGRTQQLCCFWAGESSQLLYSCITSTC